jgi:RHS repeat-associated protein
VPSGAAYFVYGEAGQLLGEYDASGAPLYESVWLGGVPVGVIQQSGSAASATLAVNLYNVWADHLGAPRVITRQSDEAIVWRWDGAEPFGASAPDANPSALGAFTFNQRLPGQMFDVETGLLQNWHREYNPRLGRYMQSDPIGLRPPVSDYLSPLKIIFRCIQIHENKLFRSLCRAGPHQAGVAWKAHDPRSRP